MKTTFDKVNIETKIQSKLNEFETLFLTAFTTENKSGVSLFSGIPGILLFLYKLYDLNGNEKIKSLAEKLMEHSFEAVENDISINTFCSGLSGMAWSINYLNKKGYIEYEAGELFEEIEELIQNKSLSDLRMGEYDYMHAGAGPAIYFVERSGQEEYLRHVVAAIDHISEKVEEGIRIPHDIHRKLRHIQKIHCEFNFGLSHGMPSVINILCLIYEKGIKREKCKELIEGCLNYIHSKKLEGYSSLYPSGEYEEGEISGSRLAWCYGDLGIGLSFWKAYKTLNIERFKDEAIAIYSFNASRRAVVENIVRDAGLCHGGAGMAHMYYRMWLETKNELFLETADYWLDVVLKMDVHENGLAGYCAVHMDEVVNDYGFLEGITGIGLVLLTRLCDDRNPDWDRILLMS